MPFDPDYLRMLVSPGASAAQRKPLREATGAELGAVNAAIARGESRTRGGTAVTAVLEGGLVPIGESIVFPIVDGIPVLLSDEAIPLPAGSGGPAQRRNEEN